MNLEQAEETYQSCEAMSQEGRYEEAIALLDTLEDVLPNSTGVAYLRAQGLAALGRTDEAAIAQQALITRISDGLADCITMSDFLSPANYDFNIITLQLI